MSSRGESPRSGRTMVSQAASPGVLNCEASGVPIVAGAPVFTVSRSAPSAPSGGSRAPSRSRIRRFGARRAERRMFMPCRWTEPSTATTMQTERISSKIATRLCARCENSPTTIVVQVVAGMTSTGEAWQMVAQSKRTALWDPTTARVSGDTTSGHAPASKLPCGPVHGGTGAALCLFVALHVALLHRAFVPCKRRIENRPLDLHAQLGNVSALVPALCRPPPLWLAKWPSDGSLLLAAPPGVWGGTPRKGGLGDTPSRRRHTPALLPSPGHTTPRVIFA